MSVHQSTPHAVYQGVPQHEATVARLGKAFGDGDVPAAQALLAPDVAWELPAPAALPYGGRYVGRDGYAEWVRRVKATLHFTKVDIAPAVGQGDRVVLLGHEEGTAIPTGQPYAYDWAQVYTFDAAGLVSGMLQYFDPASILRALATPQPLPPIPAGFTLPFYYASLGTCEVLYLVDPARVAPYLEGTGLRAADFDGRACVGYDFQRYTGDFPDFVSVVQEIELNVVAYPAAEAERAPRLSFGDYLLGNDQTKLLGNHRVHVPCDNPHAIAAGMQLFGEPKFQTTFTTALPALNAPGAPTWSFTCNDPADATRTIFSVTAELAGLDAAAADVSPQTEYGRADGRPIGCRWNVLQPYRCYDLRNGPAGRVTLTLGDSPHPMRADLAALIGDAAPAAVRTFQSTPAATQGRAYFL